MDVENASNELRVTKSDEIEADGHMLLKPLQFNGKITRLLSGWCTALPAVSVSCKLKRTQVQKMTCIIFAENMNRCVCFCDASDAV